MTEKENEDLVKGFSFAIVSLILVSFQPIVLIARPEVLDFWLFAAMSCIVMMLIFIPLVIIERKRIIKTPEFGKPTLLKAWKKKKKVLFYIGINFAIAQLIFVLAYQLAGAVSGSIVQAASVLFGLLFGFLILHEKITKIQLIFCFVLMFGLIFAITQGNFNLIEMNIGVLLMFICIALWMLAHSFTRPLLDENEITPIQLVFIRNLISGTALITTYFIFFPINNIMLIFEPINVFFIVAIGVLYGFDILFWYKSLKYADVSKVTVITAPMPLLTALLAFLILGESYTIYHFIGTLIVIGSIIIIVREESRNLEKK